MKASLPPKRSLGINYLYFGALLFLLLLTTSTSILLKENLAGSRLFFWFYAIGQSLLEVTLFVFAGSIIYRFLGKVGFWLFIGTTFICFLLHFFDFLMDLILDLSVWQTIKAFVFDESLDNFLFLLDASGIAVWAWLLFFGLLIALPFLGILVYKGTHWIVEKRKIDLRLETLAQCVVVILATLFFWDYSASRVIHPDTYTAFIKCLPWKATFLEPETVRLPLNGFLQKPPSEQALQQAIGAFNPTIEKKPNIILFITESLREDFITHETAPHLSDFRDRYISAKLPLSNANGTPLSWFSIFYSEFSLFWNRVRTEERKMGSPALALLKKIGYQIRVYTSAQLGYYAMNRVLFGEKQHLLSSYQCFHHAPPKEAFESDFEAIQGLQKDLANPSLNQGQCFIIFLDGTHFGYSWPQKETKFSPFAKELAYLSAFYSQASVELIKNRYRNAIHYIDSLFGSTLKIAPSDALIAFAGDHGEEFFDHGHLFHGSHLSHEQTTVPIYLKIGEQKKQVQLLSHIDIMPTLLEAICNKPIAFFQGESALRERKWPFAAIARFNAGRASEEFCLHNGKNKLIARFHDIKEIFKARELQIVSVKDLQEKTVFPEKKEIHSWISSEFGSGLERLFPAKNPSE